MKNNDTIKVIVSGGGTGGHIFPAIAIANGIRERYPNSEILFIGANGRMEMEKVPKAGYKIIGLNVQGLSRKSMLKNIPILVKFFLSMKKAKKIIKNFKPDFVVGVGGYASGAVLKAAVAQHIPAIIQEQNSFPGKTNIMLSKNVDAICVAYSGLEKYFPKEKIFMTGNPIRKEFMNITPKADEAFEYFGIKDRSKPVVLIVGGSQGALAINNAIAKDLQKYVDAGCFVIWQVGKTYLPTAKEQLKDNYGDSVWCSDFIYRMDLAYSVADMVISRSGAIAISELCAVGLPAILIPLPTAAENHQMKNAKALADKGAALIVENDNAEQELSTVAISLLNDKEKLQSLGTNIKKLAITDAVDRILNIIETKLLNKE